MELQIESLFETPSTLIAAIVQDAVSGQVLMLAWMNQEALTLTIQNRKGTYWSRSRQEIWVKGSTSGHTQEVESVELDCDGDAILLKVIQTGAACHTGEMTCFHRPISLTESL